MTKLKFTLMALFVIVVASALYLPQVDSYQLDGSMTLPALAEPVTVKRDNSGIPYIYAASLADGITAQGFIMAQDRLFQLELFRQMSRGRLAEMIGAKGLANDRLVRILNIKAIASRQLALLNEDELNFYQHYINGINAYINNHRTEHPLALKLMKIQPLPWTLQDAIVLQYFQTWSSSVNWRQELVNQQLIDQLGAARASELKQININPDDPATETGQSSFASQPLALHYDQKLAADPGQFAMGSNAWASGSRKSATGMPIMANDPHLDARHLPGFWHPMGLITPELRAVGAAFPGSPGFGIARTEHIAWGATNGYSDMVDLYIETLDPDNSHHYLEGQQSFAFKLRSEEIKIRDSSAEDGFAIETLEVRETRRGPVISDHGMTTNTGKVISLRWSVPEMLLSETGNRRLLTARSVHEAISAISTMPTPLNQIVIDTQGNIAMVPSGYVPLRVRGDGSAPLPVSAEDSWSGRIPFAEMPIVINPQRDWVGTSNHRITRSDYPYAYSSYSASSWRYRRLQELFEKDQITPADQWRFMLDNKNMMAERLTPVILQAINTDPALANITAILASWDFHDNKEQAAPAIFQSLYRHFSRRVFEDELGNELAAEYLSNYYYWQENLVAIIEANNSDWFDNHNTPVVETRDELFRLAARDALDELTAQLGSDTEKWQWGDIHTVSFFHPLIQGEFGAKWFGGGINPMDGSGETLNRAIYPFDDPYKTKIIASTRIVIDLADPDKLQAHIPGGVSGRLFDKHMKDSLPLWLSGTPAHWWFSDSAIESHTEHQLQLIPL